MSSKKKPATANAPRQLGDDEVVRLKDGPKFFGVGRSRLAEMIQKGIAPKPIRFSERCVGWFGRTIHEYQQSLKAK
jgi:predicted DNA-binding transcriptional regulator AlpA